MEANTGAPLQIPEIAEIAPRSGFHSVSHFARRYAQLFDCAPSE